MNRIKATEARDNLADVLNRVAYGKDRVLITRHGRDLVAVVPIEDLALIERLEDEIDVREAKKALADVRKRGSIPWEQAKEEMGL